MSTSDPPAADPPADALPGPQSKAEIDAEKSRLEHVELVVRVAEACIDIVDRSEGSGHDGRPNLDELMPLVEHPLSFVRKADLPAVAGVLAARVAWERRSADADAVLAMHRIGIAVDEWRQHFAQPEPDEETP